MRHPLTSGAGAHEMHKFEMTTPIWASVSYVCDLPVRITIRQEVCKPADILGVRGEEEGDALRPAFCLLSGVCIIRETLCNHVFSVSVEFCPSSLPDCTAPVRFGRVLLVVMEVQSLLDSRPC